MGLLLKPRSLRWTVATGFIVALTVGLCFFSLSKHSVYFYTPQEAQASEDISFSRSVRIGGMVEQNSVQWQAKKLQLNFVLTDLHQTKIHVFHNGAPPDLFKENAGVVVEGYLSKDRQTFN